MERAVAPFGSWRSPITADVVARAGRWRLSQVAWTSEAVYWLESRPREGGRSVVVRKELGDAPIDITPAGFNARTRVHEYGGGAYFVHGSSVFFSNFEDQRLYRQDAPGDAPRPITPELARRAAARYADGRVTPDGSMVVCVRELHEDGHPLNEIVAVPSDGSSPPLVLASGRDFYSFPRISPDGLRLAWTCWDHPLMPWDGTELWVGELGDDGVSGARLVAGGAQESIFQPQWDPAGVLHFVSDRTGWWNLYRYDHETIEPLAPMEAEFGQPQWLFGMSTYGFLADGKLVCKYGREGIDFLALLQEGSLEDLALSYTSIDYLSAGHSEVIFVGAAPDTPPAVVGFDLATREAQLLSSPQEAPDPGYVSVAHPLEFPSEGGVSAHALVYSPANRDFQAPAGERPPLLVMVHGGPTAHVTAALNLFIQFWTSRGFAVVDVNYRGSTGYGRDYREALKGRWGIADTLDATNAARYLAEKGSVDGDRMAIAGGSAGGFTTLCALTFDDVFAVGASHFGVSDLTALAKETHKFESRYLDSLVGPLSEDERVYYERSPINFADRISSPLILFQGLEDEVVPPSQSERIVAALKENGIPHAYLAFEGEQHGFRKAENIKRALEAELYFYSKVLGFEPADDLEPVDVENL